MCKVSRSVALVALALAVAGFCAPSLAEGGERSTKGRSAKSRSTKASAAKIRAATRRAARRKAMASKRSDGGSSRFQKRQGTQAARIEAGVKDGSLTKGEAGKMIRRQKQIGDMAKEAASDGKVTAREKVGLERAQDRASRGIARERHDGQGEMGPKPDWKVWDPGVNKRQRRQRHRIGQGIKSGSLTKEEAKELIGKERDLNKLERELKSDGKLTKDERKQLHEELDALSKSIFEEKHDDERRPKLNRKLRAKIESGEMSKDEAKELCKQMKRVYRLKRKLKGGSLTDEERKAAEEELNSLVSNLHEAKEAPVEE